MKRSLIGGHEDDLVDGCAGAAEGRLSDTQTSAELRSDVAKKGPL